MENAGFVIEGKRLIGSSVKVAFVIGDHVTVEGEGAYAQRKAK